MAPSILQHPHIPGGVLEKSHLNQNMRARHRTTNGHAKMYVSCVYGHSDLLANPENLHLVQAQEEVS